MKITKCKECGCTKMAEDRVANLERQLAEAKGKLTDGMGKALEVELGLRAENARLQEQAKEARHHWQKCEEGWNKAIKQAEGFLRDRDGWEALAKVRREALGRMMDYSPALVPGCDTPERVFVVSAQEQADAYSQAFRAIAMTPEEALSLPGERE